MHTNREKGRKGKVPAGKRHRGGFVLTRHLPGATGNFFPVFRFREEVFAVDKCMAGLRAADPEQH